MRRRFLSYDLFQTIIPVFAVSISAPLSTWKNAVHILTTRSRESGGINVGKYAVDIASSNYVCTMGDTQSIDCHMTPSLNCSFRSANKYLFKNGQNGYVGGAGEFQLVLLYANEINECLSIVGGESIIGNTWTSTQKSSIESYYYIPALGVSTTMRNRSIHVRPFTELIL